MQEIARHARPMAAACRSQSSVDPARSRPTDLPVVCGDASKLNAATGWAPRIPLDQTLADALSMRGRPWPKGWRRRDRTTSRADHGHHRTGRLVPRRSPAREGLRGLRDGSPLVDRELRAHLAPRRPGHPRPGRPARPALTLRRPGRVAAGGDLQPRGAELRPDLVEAARADRGVHVGRRDPDARGDPQLRPRDPLLPGVVLGDVRQGARGAADRNHALLPPLALRRRQGLRALHHGQLPRVLRALRRLRNPVQPRVATPRARVRHPEDLGRRRAHQARARRRVAARQPRREARLGLRRRLRRSDVDDAASRTSPTTT